MTKALQSRTSHHWENSEANARVISTAAAVSETTRMKFKALTEWPRSLESASNEVLTRTWRPARSMRSARLSTPSAASAAASKPPTATRSAATATKTATIMRLPSSFGEGEADQDIALDAEHLFLVVRFDVIEAEQVQQSVCGQQHKLLER